MKDEIFLPGDRIRECASSLHRHLRHGHAEKVYENGLANRLRKQPLDVVQQQPLKVYDEDGTLLGDFLADLFAEGRLIVELKARRALNDDHLAQLPGHHHASRCEHDPLINRGAPRLEIRKYALSDSG